MTGEWQHIPISDAIEIISGGTPKTSVSEYWGGEIPWLSVADFNTGYRWVSTAAKTITKRGVDESATTILNPGDVIISARGTVGVIAQLAQPMAFNQSCYGIRARDGVTTNDFIYYALQRAVAQMKQVAHGGVFDTITLDTFNIIGLDLPPLAEQRAIAHVLGTLDDKIELNRRINETLEAIARALFKSRFVDFDPVRAKTDGRDPGLPKPLADLFPDSFEDSELGEIPKGWSVKAIGDVAERVAMGPFGSSIKVETFVPEGVPIISGQHLRGFMLEDSKFNFITHEHAKKLSNAIVQRGDIVFTHAGSIGQAAYIPAASRYERYVISQRQFYMRCDTLQVTPTFIAFYFNTHEGQHRLLANTSSSGVPSIARPVTYLRTIRLAIPPRRILDAFERIVSPILLQFRQNVEMNGTLTTLRDALLPKLLSGAIELRDLEHFNDAATRVASQP